MRCCKQDIAVRKDRLQYCELYSLLHSSVREVATTARRSHNNWSPYRFKASWMLRHSDWLSNYRRFGDTTRHICRKGSVFHNIVVITWILASNNHVRDLWTSRRSCGYQNSPLHVEGFYKFPELHAASSQDNLIECVTKHSPVKWTQALVEIRVNCRDAERAP
jgi:hypothetical protein